ncbi:unnamed protein product, partial [Polarella glacialis]
PKEELLLEHVREFEEQFVQVYGNRFLFLCPPNEYGIPKFLPTTIRPTHLPYQELYEFKPCAQFLADFFSYDELNPPDRYPTVIPAPASVLTWCAGDCFDLSMALSSLLIGVGYDAYCVSGFAPRFITTRNEARSACPQLEWDNEEKKEDVQAEDDEFVIPKKPPLRSEYQEAKRKAEDADNERMQEEEMKSDSEDDPSSEEDEFENRRIHCWVLIRKGSREVNEDIYIEPTTGRIYEVGRCPYLKLDLIWNHKNLWVNMQVCSASQVQLDLYNSRYFEYVMLDPESTGHENGANPDDEAGGAIAAGTAGEGDEENGLGQAAQILDMSLTYRVQGAPFEAGDAWKSPVPARDRKDGCVCISSVTSRGTSPIRVDAYLACNAKRNLARLEKASLVEVFVPETPNHESPDLGNSSWAIAMAATAIMTGFSAAGRRIRNGGRLQVVRSAAPGRRELASSIAGMLSAAGTFVASPSGAGAFSFGRPTMEPNASGFPVIGSEDIMRAKEHGTSPQAVQQKLRWNVDRANADRISFFNRDYAEQAGSWRSTNFLKEVDKAAGVETTFYDSVTGKPLFIAPRGRSFEAFQKESNYHGWPSFRDEEVVWANVRCLPDGETVSVDGTHLGHNIPDDKNRYCINLVCIAGFPAGGTACDFLALALEAIFWHSSHFYFLKDDFATCYQGEKTIFYHKCKVEQYAPYTQDDGLVQRITLYKDVRRQIPLEIRERFRHRRDKLYERKRRPMQNENVERFLPGRPSTSTSAAGGALKEFREVSAVSRELIFYNSRLDGLVRCVELIGRKMFEHFEDRDDRLAYHSVTLDPSLGTARGGQKSKDTYPVESMGEVPIRKMTQKFARNTETPPDEDIHKICYFISKGEIRVDYHREPGQLTYRSCTYINEDGNLRRLPRSLPQPTQAQVQKLLQMQANSQPTGTRSHQRTQQELTSRRKDEISIRGMRSVQAGKKRDLTIPGSRDDVLEPSVYDLARESARVEGLREGAEEEKQEEQASKVDILKPYLVDFKNKDTGFVQLDSLQAELVAKKCTTDRSGVEVAGCHVYQQWQNGPGSSKVSIRSGKYKYEVDFQQMIQQNQQTFKSRGLDRRHSRNLQELSNRLAEKDQTIHQLQRCAEELERHGEEHQRLQAQLRVQSGEQLQRAQADATRLSGLRSQLAGKEKELETAEREMHLAARRQGAEEQRATQERRQLAQKVATRSAAAGGKGRSGRSTSAYQDWLQQGMPDRECMISDRYKVNFIGNRQQNIKSGGSRDIRLVQLNIDDEANELNAGASLVELQASVAVEQRSTSESVSLLEKKLSEKDSVLVEARLLAKQHAAKDELQREMELAQKRLKDVAHRQMEDKLKSSEAQRAEAADQMSIKQRHLAAAEAELIQRQAAWEECGAELSKLKQHQETILEQNKGLVEEGKAAKKTMQQAEAKLRQLLKLREEKVSDFEAQAARSKRVALNALVAQASAAHQRYLLRVLPPRGDAILRKTGTPQDLVDPEAKAMLGRSQEARTSLTGISSGVLSLLTDVPDAKDYVPSDSMLEKGSADFIFLEAIFQGSVVGQRLHYDSEEWCEPPLLDIESISIVPFPPKLLNLYSNQRERISKHYVAELSSPMEFALRPSIGTKNVNEVLFHGCPWAAVESIGTTGFNWKFRGENNGAMFGQGTYFASHASKCDLYAEKDPDGKRCVFLARVMLGQSLPRWRKCPEVKTVGEKYDSMCGIPRNLDGSVDFPEVVIFQNSQALPCFKFVYSHQAGCACNLCRRPP